MGRHLARARREQPDELIVALPVKVLAKTSAPGDGREARRRRGSLARSAHAARVAGVPILNLCFKERQSELHWEPVGLFDSPKNLAFTDISQSWDAVPDFRRKTLLAVSWPWEPAGLTGPGPTWTTVTEIMCELAEYVDFDPGRRLGRIRPDRLVADPRAH